MRIFSNQFPVVTPVKPEFDDNNSTFASWRGSILLGMFVCCQILSLILKTTSIVRWNPRICFKNLQKKNNIPSIDCWSSGFPLGILFRQSTFASGYWWNLSPLVGFHKVQYPNSNIPVPDFSAHISSSLQIQDNKLYHCIPHLLGGIFQLWLIPL